MTEAQLNEQRKQIAEYLKARRKHLQLTQEEAAALTGGFLSSRTIQRAEAGHWVNEKQLIIHLNALGISLAAALSTYKPKR